MPTIVKPISECTVTELRKYAQEVMGLEVAATANRAQIIAKLASVMQGDHIQIDAAEEANHPPLKQEDDPGEYVTVIIASTEEVGGKEPVWVSVNGRGMFIPRGQPAKIHKRYEHVLKNAVRTVYEQEVTNGIPGDIVGRAVHSYPYTVIPSFAAA